MNNVLPIVRFTGADAGVRVASYIQRTYGNGPVRVYRNLSKRKDTATYSIQARIHGRGWLVVAYSDCVYLKACALSVSLAAWERYQQTRAREVHAWIVGTLQGAPCALTDGLAITYQPQQAPHYYTLAHATPVLTARYVALLSVQKGRARGSHVIAYGRNP